MKKLYILLIILFALNVAKAQWVQQNSGTTNILSSVNFTDADTGYVVGAGGTTLKTTNGGALWTSQSSGFSGFLRSV